MTLEKAIILSRGDRSKAVVSEMVGITAALTPRPSSANVWRSEQFRFRGSGFFGLSRTSRMLLNTLVRADAFFHLYNHFCKA